MNQNNNSILRPYAQKLRRNMTKEERRLWYDFLKSLPVTVKRQQVMGPYIVDFYIASAKLVIELDGSQHYKISGMSKDRIRTQQIENRGLTVMRIPNNEVNNNFREVCEYIDSFIKVSLHNTE